VAKISHLEVRNLDYKDLIESFDRRKEEKGSSDPGEIPKRGETCGKVAELRTSRKYVENGTTALPFLPLERSSKQRKGFKSARNRSHTSKPKCSGGSKIPRTSHRTTEAGHWNLGGGLREGECSEVLAAVLEEKKSGQKSPAPVRNSMTVLG